MSNDNEQKQTVANVLTFDPRRPRAVRQSREQGRNHNGRIEGVIISTVLDRTPIAEMTSDDASTGHDAELLVTLRREVSTIERAYRKSRRAGRLAVLAFACEHFAAGYNVGAEDDRISLKQAIGRLVA